MTPFWEALLAKYGWILIGLTFGFAAKYALLIKRGVKVQARLVFADLLLLPIVALISFWMAARIGFQSEAAALFASFCTVGADRLVKVLTDRFLQKVDNEATNIANDMLGRARSVVASEQAGARIIDDTISGRAPAEYVALKPRPIVPPKATDG